MAQKADPEREQRLAKALRQNLRRRKAQAGRDDGANEAAAEPRPDGPDGTPQRRPPRPDQSG